MRVFRVVDLETTDETPADGDIIEIGWCDLQLADDGDVFITPKRSALFSPPRGNKIEARAVHHITDAELSGKPVCDTHHIRDFLMIDGRPPNYLVAHHAQFEQQWLTPDICREIPWICTFKVARRTHPTLRKHNNSFLRYLFEADGFFDPLGEEGMPPHRAAPDAYVTAHILSALLQHATVAEMLQWTTEPPLLSVFNFGKHKGQKLAEVPYDYLSWIVFKSDLDDDTKWNCRQEMDRRGAGRR
ncbi:exonuclease [Caulobacter phage Sansa]|uniref:Exonuclease n=1 Tax=Caulobacter phage Sansa TaxID=1675600 RepID=A0A0K1LLS9_9CAUD|nr:exonuclease [Caulobacter phage Sansa]AKU43467.1 exonuclease [Caulobacter phage Sansa]